MVFVWEKFGPVSDKPSVAGKSRPSFGRESNVENQIGRRQGVNRGRQVLSSVTTAISKRSARAKQRHPRSLAAWRDADAQVFKIQREGGWLVAVRLGWVVGGW
jgi:hypothetical protein